MAIKAIVQDLDSVEEQFRGLYAEKDGVFVLQIGGLQEHPDAKALKGALDRVRGEKRELTEKLTAVESRLTGLPDDFDGSAYETLKQAAEGKGGAPTEEQIQQIRDKVRQTLETKYNGEIQTRDERNAKLNAALQRMTIDDGLSRAMDEASIDPRHKAKLLPYLKSAGKIQVEEDGDVFKASVETDLGPVSLSRFVTDWAGSDDGKIYVAKSTGPNPPGGKGNLGGKTMKRADFNALDHKAQRETVSGGTQIVD
ncbi:hypothetical protein SJ05684_c10610 [Sinorhizobium sojae CCBAU 05684]|uniref:Phage protein n=1 Tax=Sinorhizobium sojae CCBAU 05684 TaxID=716928 RepID=A0A249P9D1_9HYPH|nr:hypothetical protein [Sinorhizobium sojae]ASY62518.1 hypothetical protein SJ05684_c10610 [Sinorhizobium sojae CCBAU 05684]